MTADPRRGQRKFLLVAALFFAPLVAAWLLYAVFPSLQPQNKTHHGTLIDPARPLPAFRFSDAQGAIRDATALRGKWSFVYLGAAECAQDCRDRLYALRQLRALLNEKRLRVQRVYVAPDAAALAAARTALGDAHPDLLLLAQTPDGPAPDEFFGAGDPQALYLVDPLGNWLMTYPGGAAAQGILKDVRRLLRLSQIG